MVDKKIVNKKEISNTRRIEKNKRQRHDIAKKEHIESTVNVSKVIIKVIIILLIILGFVYGICRYVGNYGLYVREYMLDYENLPDSFYGLKIVQISDVNYNSKTMPMNKVKLLISEVNKLNPDIIVFTGNLIYGEVSQKELKELEELFSKFKSNIGKYAVFGEDNSTSKIIIKNAGFIDIENSYELVYKNNYEPILISGISYENYDIKSALSYFDLDNANMNIFTILLSHKPDRIDDISNYNVNMVLSGYNLNGQIRIPKIGGLIKRNSKYLDSYYKINNTDLFISNGLGTRNNPYRLFNHPSISLFRVK